MVTVKPPAAFCSSDEEDDDHVAGGAIVVSSLLCGLRAGLWLLGVGIRDLVREFSRK